jgi:hypothetical protein
MPGRSFERFLTVTASTKRPPALVAGKRGAPVTNLATLLIGEFQPTSPEIVATMVFDGAHDILTTYCDGAADVLEGDLLTVAGKDYPVRVVAHLKYRRLNMLELRVEETKP